MSTRQVLIVDDNPDDLEALQRTLSLVPDCQYKIRCAISSEQAFKQRNIGELDCLIMDYNLPGISGLALFHKLKRKFSNTPILVLTGQTDQKSAANIIQHGAKNYIDKYSVTPAKLHQLITEAITSQKEDNKTNQLPDTIEVLIIDDSPDDTELIIRTLDKAINEYHFSTAKSGTEALAKLESAQPHCVLLDYSLPGKTGLELLPDILNIRPYTPVILLTGQGNESVAVQTIKNGAENYIVKSEVETETLNSHIKTAILKKRFEYSLAEKEKILVIKQRQLEESNAFMEVVLESLPDILFVKDCEHRIVKANRKFMELYPESSRDKVIGYTTVESYPPEEAEEFLEKDREAFEQGYSNTIEAIHFPSGEERTLNTRKRRFFNQSGHKFILAIGTDVTERELLINRLKKSNDDLEQFAYIASHDLKSPLSAIRKLVSWINEDYRSELPDGAIKHFDLIRSRADRMAALLEDLLTYSRIEKQQDSLEPIELRDFCISILEMLDLDNRISLQVKQQSLVLPKVALKLILMNLFGNVIKHHHLPKGAIKVEVEQLANTYVISVLDDGPGIPAEHADRVFQMFQTLKPRDEVEGSGMGLALVRKVLAKYNGTITLDTDVTQGCKFQITWPIRNLEPVTEDV